MTTDKTLRLPDQVHVLIWKSDFAGNVPGPEILDADFDLEALKSRSKEGETYDGVFMETRGTVRQRTLTRPKAIDTLLEKGASIDFNADGTAVGCWFEGEPWEKISDTDDIAPWDWSVIGTNVEQYIEACRIASGGDPDDGP